MKMEEFTHPIDLAAAIWGELISVDVNISDNNIAVLSQNFEQSSFARYADDPLPSYDLLGVVPNFHSFTACFLRCTPGGPVRTPTFCP